MKITENPFAVLGASPRDNRKQLMERADEAALLGGASMDEAVASLMQMNRRIVAEVSWFPGADEETAGAFLDYAKGWARGQAKTLPSTEKLDCPLAQANALAALFEIWPDSRAEYLTGLCRSMDLILSKVTLEGTMARINEDRLAGGWETIPDRLTLAEPLEARLRELTQVIRDRMAGMRGDDEVLTFYSGMTALPGLDAQGTVSQAMADAYLMRIHDEEQRSRNRIRDQLKGIAGGNIRSENLTALKPPIEKWCRMTAPLRKDAGPMRRAGQEICQDMRNRIVDYVNNAPTSKKQLSKTVPVFNGTKTITLTYESKADAVKEAITLTGWLLNLFPEQSNLVEMLKKDKNILQDMIVNEESRAREKLMMAR